MCFRRDFYFYSLVINDYRNNSDYRSVHLRDFEVATHIPGTYVPEYERERITTLLTDYPRSIFF